MSFERILVPLDGSHLGEASLRPAEALAQKLGSVLVLAHALEKDPPEQRAGESHLTDRETATAYLERQRERLVGLGIAVEVEILPAQDDDVAQTLADLAQRRQAGVIIISAYGRRSLRDLLLGPIAQRALRTGPVPILMRTRGTPVEAPFALERILMPVDFRHSLAQTREYVRELAVGFGASVTLLHAIERPASLQFRMLPSASATLRAFQGGRARERLNRIVRHVDLDGAEVDTVIRVGQPEDLIIEEARKRACDLIVLSTHARAGVMAWSERSIGSRLIQEPGLTLLLLHEP